MTKEWKQGYVHVYTGDGKGKTTAAIGLAARAAGAGLRVYIGQFIKGMRYSEHDALSLFNESITVRQFGRGCFIYDQPADEDLKLAEAGLNEIDSVISAGEHDIVILDEANVAVDVGLFPVERLLDIIARKPAHVELVLTGRKADPRLIAAADLVTEMREIKHYHAAGVEARKGIEG